MLISEETGLIQTRALEAVQMTLDCIAAALANGDKVELRDFGIFEVRIIKPRAGRNPHNPEVEVMIPARARVKFRARGELKDGVSKLTPKRTKKGP